MQIGYWAQLEGDDAAQPSVMLGTVSHEDAAGAFAQQLVEQSEGEWTEGVIRVWGAKEKPEDAIVFDVTASFMESEDEEGEVDCELEIIPRD
jgi:hypothetical protein